MFDAGLYDIIAMPGLSCDAAIYVPFAKRTLLLPYMEQLDVTVVDVVDFVVVDEVEVDVDEVVEDVVVDVVDDVVDDVEDVVVIVGAALELEAVRPPMLITCVPGPH